MTDTLSGETMAGAAPTRATTSATADTVASTGAMAGAVSATAEPRIAAPEILAAVCAVMEVVPTEMPGKTTPRTRPRLQWTRSMAAFVMHDLGLSDTTIARVFGNLDRLTIRTRRKRMEEKLETSRLYREHHNEILRRLAKRAPGGANNGDGHHNATPSNGSSPSCSPATLAAVSPAELP